MSDHDHIYDYVINAVGRHIDKTNIGVGLYDRWIRQSNNRAAVITVWGLSTAGYGETVAFVLAQLQHEKNEP